MRFKIMLLFVCFFISLESLFSSFLSPSIYFFAPSGYMIDSLSENSETIDFSQNDVLLFRKSFLKKSSFMGEVSIKLYFSAINIRGKIDIFVTVFRYERFGKSKLVFVGDYSSPCKNLIVLSHVGNRESATKEKIVTLDTNVFLDYNEYNFGDEIRVMIRFENTPIDQKGALRLFMGKDFPSQIRMTQINE